MGLTMPRGLFIILDLAKSQSLLNPTVFCSSLISLMMWCYRQIFRIVSADSLLLKSANQSQEVWQSG